MLASPRERAPHRGGRYRRGGDCHSPGHPPVFWHREIGVFPAWILAERPLPIKRHTKHQRHAKTKQTGPRGADAPVRARPPGRALVTGDRRIPPHRNVRSTNLHLPTFTWRTALTVIAIPEGMAEYLQQQFT